MATPSDQEAANGHIQSLVALFPLGGEFSYGFLRAPGSTVALRSGTGAGPYYTRYEPYGIGTAFFQNLYKNRSWLALQLAYTAEF